MHKLIDYSMGINPTLMCLILLGIIVVGRITSSVLMFVLRSCRIISKENALNRDFDVDEKLSPYFNCLPGVEQMKWYANEAYLRAAL